LAPVFIGAGMSGDAAINPLISRKQQQGVLKHIERARQEGARVVSGGELLEGEGFYVQPTILADIDHSMAVAREEVFGPVLGVMPFADEDAVIALANDNRYGLVASLHAEPGRGSGARLLQPPRLHYSPIQFFPIRHTQHPSGVQSPQVTSQLMGDRTDRFGVGSVLVQYGFVFDQVFGYPIAKLRQDGGADEIKGSLFLVGSHG
jgi:hypothetical protein